MLYPKTRKSDQADTYFGTKVSDPYRWLENDTSAETGEWVKAQNEVAFGYLEKIPFRNTVKKRIEEVINYERVGIPTKQGHDLYISKNNGLQNHFAYYRLKNGKGTPELFLDPNTFSEDGTTSLDDMSFTQDGSLLTYLISEGGSDWRKAITIKTNDKSIIGDTLVDLKFTGIAWRGNDGFYYSSYEKPKGSELSSMTQNHKLLYHKLGTLQSEDRLIFGGDKLQRRYISGTVTEDDRFLIISAANSTTGNEIYIQEISKPGSGLVTIVGDMENSNSVLDNVGSTIIMFTNNNAPNGKIVAFDMGNPSPENWKDLIPETENTLESVVTAGRNIFAIYLKDAASYVKQFDYNGRFIREVKLPDIGTAGGFSGKRDEETVYYAFTSFYYPSTIFAYNIKSGKSEIYQKPDLKFSPGDFETKQVFYKSKDGTSVPMFVVHKKGVELNGKNPTILYGYGGFNVSLTPAFSASRIVWLENGGIYAQPNLRGGGEYGEQWHVAGTKMQKQNVFDDFIAAAEYLISNNYTSREYLALSGGSNGGLLVGATITQRPDLAKVALPAVGVLDMLRYHTFTAGAGWAYDYGTAEDSKEMFEYLLGYSPVHTLRPNTSYPATLITTADHDDRVVPAHSFKFAATMQECQVGQAPVLIRIDTKSGHGPSNLSKSIERITDEYVFTWYNMGIIPPVAKKEM